MNIIIWISWFICGLIAAVIYNKKYKIEKHKINNFMVYEFLLFIWGWISLFIIVFNWLLSKFY